MEQQDGKHVDPMYARGVNDTLDFAVSVMQIASDAVVEEAKDRGPDLQMAATAIKEFLTDVARIFSSKKV